MKSPTAFESLKCLVESRAFLPNLKMYKRFSVLHSFFWSKNVSLIMWKDIGCENSGF